MAFSVPVKSVDHINKARVEQFPEEAQKLAQEITSSPLHYLQIFKIDTGWGCNGLNKFKKTLIQVPAYCTHPITALEIVQTCVHMGILLKEESV